MKRLPPWRWSAWGPWPPDGSGTSQEEIRKLAYLLSTLDSSRSADENWIKATNELAEPLPWSRFFRWLGLSDKKGWDWLELLSKLSIPLVVAAGGWILSEKNIEQQRQANLIKQHDLVVSGYITKIQELYLEKGLRNATSTDPVAVVARAMTKTSLLQLEPASQQSHWDYKHQILSFLYEAALIHRQSNSFNTKPNISLRSCNFMSANLRNAYLEGADLTGAWFMGSNLSNARLVGADLTKALLGHAVLTNADLRGADLSSADLSKAVLIDADLRGADLDNIQWDMNTIWPDSRWLKGARNIPAALRKELSL